MQLCVCVTALELDSVVARVAVSYHSNGGQLSGPMGPSTVTACHTRQVLEQESVASETCESALCTGTHLCFTVSFMEKQCRLL